MDVAPFCFNWNASAADRNRTRDMCHYVTYVDTCVDMSQCNLWRHRLKYLAKSLYAFNEFCIPHAFADETWSTRRGNITCDGHITVRAGHTTLFKKKKNVLIGHRGEQIFKMPLPALQLPRPPSGELSNARGQRERLGLTSSFAINFNPASLKARNHSSVSVKILRRNGEA